MVSAGGAATPHGLGSLNEMALLPRNRPQGIGFSPCATLFRNPGKCAEPSEKRPWGGIWDSGAGQWSCNSGVRQSHEWGEFREFRQDEEVLQEIIKHLRLTSLSFGFLRTPHFRSPLGRGRTSSHAQASASSRVIPPSYCMIAACSSNASWSSSQVFFTQESLLGGVSTRDTVPSMSRVGTPHNSLFFNICHGLTA